LLLASTNTVFENTSQSLTNASSISHTSYHQCKQIRHGLMAQTNIVNNNIQH